MSVELLATLLVLVSALLHAVVNAIVKASGDGLLTRGFMNAVALVVALPCVPFVPLPDHDVWNMLLLSMLVHGAYPFFLVGAYRHGDLSAMFPLARGIAPLGVLGFVWATTTGPIGVGTTLSVITIATGVASLAFERPVLLPTVPRRGIILAGFTGLIIATYTIIDGVGLRMAQTPASYIVWLFVLDGAFVSAWTLGTRSRAVPDFLRHNWKSTLAGGILAVITYGMALLALALGSLAEIAALRETSIIFAVFIARIYLGEAFGRRRVLASALVLLGVVGLQFSR